MTWRRVFDDCKTIISSLNVACIRPHFITLLRFKCEQKKDLALVHDVLNIISLLRHICVTEQYEGENKDTLDALYIYKEGAGVSRPRCSLCALGS